MSSLIGKSLPLVSTFSRHVLVYLFIYRMFPVTGRTHLHQSSMSQELFVSVNQLIEMSEVKGNRYDHVVIESSGISEPKSVRSVFQDAESYGVQLMDKVRPSACNFRFVYLRGI